MTQPLSYTTDQTDALKELLNIAMGQAADSLARALGAYITITIPSIEIVPAAELAKTQLYTEQREKNISSVRQGFFNDLRGEAIAVFGAQDSHAIADLMGYDELDNVAEQELLLDVANVLIGACMTGFGNQINASIGFAPPSIMNDDVPQHTLFEKEIPSWNYALLMKLNFSLKEREFSCDMLFFMPEDSIEKVRTAVDKYLESL